LENPHDPATKSATGTTPDDLAHRSSRYEQPTCGLSSAGAGIYPALDGIGRRTGGSETAPRTPESTRPLDATRELATSAGSLIYRKVSERLAVNIVDCLDDLLNGNPEDIEITSDWIRAAHLRLAGDLFPDWAGSFRATDVQVGCHFPPPCHAVAVHVENFCRDLAERLQHLNDAEAITELLAWVDWRFQWIHPFKDFNGRVGRILLVALCFRLGLPPVDPAADEAGKAAYFAALRQADGGDLSALKAVWVERLKP
jgi:fido (protein-threonine AMPylation protein)